MATIIGGIGVSHTPTIGFAYDTNKQNDPAWAPIFESFEPIRAWFKEKRPDALVYIFNQAGLSEEEKDLLRRRDWRGMIHFGVTFFMLEKLGATIGTSNLHIYAAMRGESFEDFMKTRNTRVLYSVTGTDAAHSLSPGTAEKSGTTANTKKSLALDGAQ